MVTLRTCLKTDQNLLQSNYLCKVRELKSERRTLKVTSAKFEQAITAKSYDNKRAINCSK